MKFKSILKTVLVFGVGMTFGYLIKAAMDISDEDVDEVENDEYDEEDDDDFYDPDMDEDEEFESDERPETENKKISEEENTSVSVNDEKAETDHAVCSDTKVPDKSQNESILGAYGSTVDPRISPSMVNVKSYLDSRIENANRRKYEETTEAPLIKPEDC